MKNTYIFWKGWIWTAIILAICLLLLNFILPIKSFFPTIGDEIEWFKALVTIIAAIIAAIVGYILDKQYKSSESEKELKRNVLRSKIENSRSFYSELERLVQNNLSVLNFNNFSKLIHQIDAKTINTELLSNICDYQSKIADSQNSSKIFFQNIQETGELIVYKAAIAKFVKIYDEILSAYIGYLSAVDNSFHRNMTNIETLIPLANEQDKLQLSLLKISGTNMVYEWKAKFLGILDSQKTTIEKLTNVLDTATGFLLSSENHKIELLVIELDSIR